MMEVLRTLVMEMFCFADTCDDFFLILRTLVNDGGVVFCGHW